MKGCLIVILVFLGITMFSGVIVVALGFAAYLIEILLPFAVLAALGYLIYWILTKDSKDKYSPKKRNSKRRKR